MISITATERWKRAYPGAMIGLLEVSGIDNTTKAAELDAEKRRVEAEVRERYAIYERNDFRALPVIAAYHEYYKRFKKTYHVLQQVESVALKGRNLPDVSPLVDANFAAEMKTLLLTAGHDLDKLSGEIVMDIASADEEITQMNGKTKTLYPNDMVMRVDGKVICSIIYGQDNHSFITPKTRHVLYVTYVPTGIPQKDVEHHLNMLEKHVQLFAKNANIEGRKILKAK